MSRAFAREPFLLRLKFNADRLVLIRARCRGMNNVQSLGMVEFGGDPSGRHEFAVIAPRAALIVGDVGYVDIVEDAAERRHRTGVQHAPGLGALTVSAVTDTRASVMARKRAARSLWTTAPEERNPHVTVNSGTAARI